MMFFIMGKGKGGSKELVKRIFDEKRGGELASHAPLNFEMRS
jgi:hypothetical protein